MARKKAGSVIQEQFADLGVHQELNQAKLTIEELTAEIELLKQEGDKQQEEEKVNQLYSSLQGQGLIELPINAIQPNPQQPRKTFTAENLILLGRSLEIDGLQQPLLVWQVNENQYFLLDGERRWRAALEIGWETIKALILPSPIEKIDANPELVRRQALLVNHHRENLNPLDLAEALVAEIESSLGIKASQSPKLLSAVMTRLSRKKRLEVVSGLLSESKSTQEEVIKQWVSEGLVKDLEAQVLLFLLSLQLNPISVKTNIFPTLNLFTDLKRAIREKGLGGHQARILQRLSPSNLGKSSTQSRRIRDRVVKEVIEQKLSVTATRARVKQEIEGSKTDTESSLGKVVELVLTKIDKLEVESLNEVELKALADCLEGKLRMIQERMND